MDNPWKKENSKWFNRNSPYLGKAVSNTMSDKGSVFYAKSGEYIATDSTNHGGIYILFD